MPRLSLIGTASTGSFGFGTGAPYYVECFLVAGGGGGSNGEGNGGGGGGVVDPFTLLISPGGSYLMVVGVGGVPASNGLNSSAFGRTAVGGGGAISTDVGVPGASGGSGGGGGSTSGTGTRPGGAGTAGQGNAGGSGFFYSEVGYYAPGSGGGAGAPGTQGGDGGAGRLISMLATPTYFGGGGGVGGDFEGPSGFATAGGIGGGGYGAFQSYGGNGTANTGGGGGGAYQGSPGGTGGSGIIVLRYVGGQRAVGGTVSNYTSSGIYYTEHRFTTVGSSTFIA